MSQYTQENHVFVGRMHFFPLCWHTANRRLKNAVMGAAISAIERGDNAFKDYYERMLANGITPVNARHSVARKIIATMSAMWKTGNAYDETLV